VQEVAVVVVDVSESKVLALPHYRGEIYVYLAIVAGGIFVLTMAPVLLISCIISVSAQPWHAAASCAQNALLQACTSAKQILSMPRVSQGVSHGTQ
jgi:hypothetical protein